MLSNRHGVSSLRIVALHVALVLSVAASQGQTAALAAPRVIAAVDSSQTVTLKGNTHPLAQARFDRGMVPDSAPTGHLMMVLKPSDAQQAALEQLLAAQQDPHSASYHKWLKPESFGAQFGVSDADVQAVTSYLSAQGFTVSRVYSNKMAIEFSGTAGQIRSSFQTELHTYSALGQTFHANATDPKIPAALAPVVSGIAALNNYRTPRPATPQPSVLGKKTGGIRPQYWDFNNLDVSVLSPGDLALEYDIPTSTYTGQGVTVGVINDSNINLAIPANYRTTFGLPTTVVPTVFADGDDPGINADEALGYKEVELISAVAPLANINYYVSGTTDYTSGVEFATFRAVEDNTVQVLVFPFETCERDLGAAANFVISNLWEQAAAQGISVIVGAGNGGAASCDALPAGSQKTQANQGLAVNGYASTAYNTAVGASDFALQGRYVPDYFSFSLAPTNYINIKQYVPEQPNNSSNRFFNENPFSSSVVAASGGGVSTLGQVTIATPFAFVSGPHPQPAYQVGVAGAISTSRVVPDISMFGGTLDNNFASYILCIDANDCLNGSPNGLQYTPGGDSNASAAVFGGVAALLVQAKGTQGNLNPTLYATYARTPSAFHDITVGTNQVACAAGSPNCGGGGFTTGYSATAGYDAASGLGSVDVAQLISAWQGPATGVATVVVSLTQPGTLLPITGIIRHGDPVQLNVTVTGTSGTPTGDVAFTTSSPQASGVGVERLTLANGTAVDNNLTYLPGGSFSLTARYAGDSVFGPATRSIPVTVARAATRIDVLSQSFTNGSTQAYGLPVQFTLLPVNPANTIDVGRASGSVTVRDNGADLTILPLSSLGAVTFQSNSINPGTHSFTAIYTGDNSYAAGSLSTPLTLTVAPAPSSTTLSSATTNLPSHNGTVELVAQVTSTQAGGTGRPPHGSVQFIGNGSVAATVGLNIGSSAGANPVATAIYRVNPNGNSQSSITYVATFVPDTTNDYAASTSAPLTVAIGSATGFKTTTTTIATTPAGATNFVNTSALSFTASVTAPGNGSITGTVSFFANGTALGAPATLNNSGVATLNVPTDASGVLALPVGQSYIVAQYNGDANNAVSTATPPYTVNIYGHGSTPDFTMQSQQSYGVLSPTIASTSFRLQFTALDNFFAIKTPVNLSIQAPTGIACTANPLSVVFNGNSYPNATVTCTAAPGTTIAQLSPSNPRLLWVAEGGAAFACVLLFGMPARRRSWQAMLGMFALMAISFGVTGCGVNFPDPSKSSTSTSGQAGVAGGGTAQAGGVLTPGTYTVVVTGTASVISPTQPNTTINVIHTLPLSIVVQ